MALSGPKDTVSNPPPPKDDAPPVLKTYAKELFLKAIRYLLWNVFVYFCYTVGLYAELLIFNVVTKVLKEDIETFPLIKTWFEYARIGLALLTILAAVVHGLLSTIEQIKRDAEWFQHGGEPR